MYTRIIFLLRVMLVLHYMLGGHKMNNIENSILLNKTSQYSIAPTCASDATLETTNKKSNKKLTIILIILAVIMLTFGILAITVLANAILAHTAITGLFLIRVISWIAKENATPSEKEVNSSIATLKKACQNTQNIFFSKNNSNSEDPVYAGKNDKIKKEIKTLTMKIIAAQQGQLFTHLSEKAKKKEVEVALDLIKKLEKLSYGHL